MRYWHELSLDDWKRHTLQTDWYVPWQAYMRMLTAAKFDFPVDLYKGQGIVIPAGGRLLPGAWVTVRLLREFGCTLPVEIWHIGPAEVPDLYRKVMEPHGVEFRDIQREYAVHPCARMSGWQLKVAAVILSRFCEVLMLDADSHPVKDPAFLFRKPQYLDMGAAFWPDRCRTAPDNPLWEVFGAEYVDEPDHETGQVIVDKSIHWKALQIAMHANQFSQFYYRYSHGDTQLLRFAIKACKGAYSVAPRMIEVPVDRPVEDLKTLETTPYLRQEGDIRAMFIQRDFDGAPLFQHRSAGGGAQAAFGLGENKRIQHFAHEDKCLAYVDELRQHVQAGDFWQACELIEPEKMSPHRRDAFALIFRLMQGRGLKDVVETGTLRQKNNWHWDGGSSYWFAKYVRRFGGRFWTVDIDPDAIAVAMEIVGQQPDDPVAFIVEDSLKFLREPLGPDERIDVAFLDSFDFSPGQHEAAQLHNLAECQLVMPRMNPRGLICIDDYGLENHGKGGLSVPVLQASGWRLIHAGYCAVLSKET